MSTKNTRTPELLIEHRNVDDDPCQEEWVDSDGQRHNSDGPAYVLYSSQGVAILEQWYQYGEIHRVDGPAEIGRYPGGGLAYERWVQRGILHRLDGSVLTEYREDGTVAKRQWCCHYTDVSHATVVECCEDGSVESERWQDNTGEHHRVDGPAVVEYYPNGQQKRVLWYQNGILHRADGPAIVEYYPNGVVSLVEYRVEGVLDRERGAARVRFTPSGILVLEEWYKLGGLDRQTHGLSGPDRPAVARYYDSGKPKTFEFWQYGVHFRRDGGPGVVEFFEDGTVLSEQ